MRRVVSLWFPRFAIERRRPSPEAAPFVLFHREGGRELLFAVDPEGEAAGLAPGMSLSEARALCPSLRNEQHAPAADAAALARLADWTEAFTPWVALDTLHELGGGAGLWLDVTGCAHLFGGEEALLHALLSGCGRLGYEARAGLADTAGTAWAVARHGCDGRRPLRLVAPGEQRRVLEPLPVSALRLSAEKVELLARFGLTRIDDLLALPPANLASRLGPEAGARLRQALGQVGEAISPRRPQPPQEVRLAFGEPIATAEDLAAAAERLLGQLCQRLEKAGQGARRLRLSLFRADGSRQDLGFATSRASREKEHLARLFAQQREKLEPGFGVDAVALAAEEVESLSALQIVLHDTGQETARDGELVALVDRLALRLGTDAVGRQLPRESHLPERAVACRPAGASSSASGWRATPPRPLRLFERPEPVEALALLPDHPPAHFRWRCRLHRIARAEGPERLSPEWWRGDPMDERDYFRVEDEDGRRFWLYRQAGRWFLQGLFG